MRGLTGSQRSTVLACFLGWTLDAFDFFLLVFVVPAAARGLHASVADIALVLTVTLAMRPVGALIFGRLADRYGRRLPLMLDVLLYSFFGLMTAVVPSFAWLMVVRALYGIAMGGEWGVGAALMMESVPTASRGLLSGLLQEGYVAGYLLAAVAYFFVFPLLGWRAMFVVGALPALLVFFIRRRIPESPVWQRARSRPSSAAAPPPSAVLRGQLGFLVYLVALMTALSFLAHGTQDLYPTFLQVQRGFSPRATAVVAVIFNLGALLGGIVFGSLSARLGRRRAMVAAVLLAFAAIPLLVLPRDSALLVAGAFTMQFFVQGAWGVVPVHLNELTPAPVRATLTGVVYQLGNLFAAINAYLQARIAVSLHGDYGAALAIVAAITAPAAAVLAWRGREAKDVSMEVGGAPSGGERLAPGLAPSLADGS